LSSRLTTIESILPKIISQVVQVLESCNENAKSIQSFNSTILEFTKQFQFIPAALGSRGMRDHASPLVHNATHVVENNALLEKKRKNLATDGLVGCSYATF
jgi:serine acetyltransferase